MYNFDYQRPADRAAATAAFKGDARYLAGGQTLIQAMKMRLSNSERLVDLGAIADLKGKNGTFSYEKAPSCPPKCYICSTNFGTRRNHAAGP